MTEPLLTRISREFLNKKSVHRYRMKKIADMSGDDVIRVCHSYVEENGLADEWSDFRAEMESEYHLCPYCEEYIPMGLCYDMQMINGGYITPSALPDMELDRARLSTSCDGCAHKL